MFRSSLRLALSALVLAGAALAPQIASATTDPCAPRTMTLVFASNISDTTKGCSRDDFGGCDLWLATVSLPTVTEYLASSPPRWVTCSPSVTSLTQVTSTTNYGEGFPTLFADSSGVKAAAFNVYDPTKLSTYAKNSVVVRSGSSLSTVVATIPHAVFPDFSRVGTKIAYTALGSTDTSNIAVQDLTTGYYPIPGVTTISTNTDLEQDKASDPVFLPSGNGFVYHAARHDPNNTYHDMIMAVDGLSGGYDRRVSGYTDSEGQFCGHFSITNDGAHVSCSRTDTQAIHVMESQNSTGLPLLEVATQEYLVWKDDAYYQALYPTQYGSCSNGILHAYTEWGNTSDHLLMTVMCVGTGDATTASKLFFVNVNPSAPDADETTETPDSAVLDLSVLIEDYAVANGLVPSASAGDIDECTGDFYLSP